MAPRHASPTSSAGFATPRRRAAMRFGTHALRMLAPALLLAAISAATAACGGPEAGQAAIASDEIASSTAVIETPATPATQATVRWTPERVPEGTLFTVFVEGGDPPVASATGEFAGEPLHFVAASDAALASLAAAPLDSVGGRRLVLEIVHGDGSRDARQLEIDVAPGDYAMQRLTVAPEFGQPYPPDVQQRIDEEYERAMAVARGAHDTPRLWQPPFVAPRDSRVTSGFGHGRSFNGEVQSRHTGTDFAGAVGAPILAPARGVVALADTFYLGGGVLYIDHGAGLVTGYLHLSAHEVAAGDTVEAGQLVARVGATGRVTGPHLHWIVRYGPHSVDPLSLLELESPVPPAEP